VGAAVAAVFYFVDHETPANSYPPDLIYFFVPSSKSRTHVSGPGMIFVKKDLTILGGPLISISLDAMKFKKTKKRMASNVL
jgi:hypothetical protein